ncbi:MAG: aldo/keto reductase, partial [Planctomycetota bacterium]
MIESRKLSAGGPDVSRVGFGAWALGGQFGPQVDSDSEAALHLAIESGVRLIDTAPGYGDGRSERVIAKVLSELGQQANDVVVATKTPPDDGP